MKDKGKTRQPAGHLLAVVRSVILVLKSTNPAISSQLKGCLLSAQST
jgi:hypothetical protein